MKTPAFVGKDQIDGKRIKGHIYWWDKVLLLFDDDTFTTLVAGGEDGGACIEFACVSLGGFAGKNLIDIGFITVEDWEAHEVERKARWVRDDRERKRRMLEDLKKELGECSG